MSINRKRGSIALARQLCYQINGAADDSDDSDGGGYGSVDIAEILSAEVVQLQEALAQRTWVRLTDKVITQVIDSMPKKMRGFMVDWDLYELARAIESKLKERNT